MDSLSFLDYSIELDQARTGKRHSSRIYPITSGTFANSFLTSIALIITLPSGFHFTVVWVSIGIRRVYK